MTQRLTGTLSRLLAVAFIAGASPVQAEKHDVCVVAKSAAVANAFNCVVKRRNAEIRSGSAADLTGCQTKLEEDFTEAEGAGDCLVVGDIATAWSLVTEAEDTLLDERGLASVDTPGERACLVGQNRAVARYVHCLNRPANSILSHWQYATGGGVADERCYYRYLYALADVVEGGECVVSDGLPLPSEDPGPPSQVFRYMAGTNLSGASIFFTNPYPVYSSSPHYFLYAYMPYSDFSGAVLPYFYLQGAMLTGADFTNADMQYAYFKDADLTGAVFTGASVFAAQFGGANLTGVDLSGADLTPIRLDAPTAACPSALPSPWVCRNNYMLGPGLELSGTVTGADFSGVDLENASLISTVFDDVDLAGADLSGSYLLQTQFTGTTSIVGVDLSNADLRRIDLSGMDLTGVSFTNAHFYAVWEGFDGVRAVGLIHCPLTLPASVACIANNIVGLNIDASGANLAGADLSGMDLRGAWLKNANLAGANLSSTDLLTTCFGGADLTGVNWTGARCPDASMSAANGNTCCGHESSIISNCGTSVACGP